jgi:hypothetical protein
MTILGEVYLPLLTQDEVWRTPEGRYFSLDEMPAKHRNSVLALLQRIAVPLYADWVHELLGAHWDDESRLAYGIPAPDRGTGRYPQAEVLTWFEAQPLVRRLRALAAAEHGCGPPLIELLDQVEIWRTDSGVVVPLESLSPEQRCDLLGYLEQEALQLYGEWLVEATEEELSRFSLSPDDLDAYEYGPAEAREWLMRQPLVRRLQALATLSFRGDIGDDARRTA